MNPQASLGYRLSSCMRTNVHPIQAEAPLLVSRIVLSTMSRLRALSQVTAAGRGCYYRRAYFAHASLHSCYAFLHGIVFAYVRPENTTEIRPAPPRHTMFVVSHCAVVAVTTPPGRPAVTQLEARLGLAKYCARPGNAGNGYLNRRVPQR